MDRADDAREGRGGAQGAAGRGAAAPRGDLLQRLHRRGADERLHPHRLGRGRRGPARDPPRLCHLAAAAVTTSVLVARLVGGVFQEAGSGLVDLAGRSSSSSGCATSPPSSCTGSGCPWGRARRRPGTRCWTSPAACPRSTCASAATTRSPTAAAPTAGWRCWRCGASTGPWRASSPPPPRPGDGLRLLHRRRPRPGAHPALRGRRRGLAGGLAGRGQPAAGGGPPRVPASWRAARPAARGGPRRRVPARPRPEGAGARDGAGGGRRLRGPQRAAPTARPLRRLDDDGGRRGRATSPTSTWAARGGRCSLEALQACATAGVLELR